MKRKNTSRISLKTSLFNPTELPLALQQNPRLKTLTDHKNVLRMLMIFSRSFRSQDFCVLGMGVETPLYGGR